LRGGSLSLSNIDRLMSGLFGIFCIIRLMP
jgi:hypothetical protein